MTKVVYISRGNTPLTSQFCGIELDTNPNSKKLPLPTIKGEEQRHVEAETMCLNTMQF